MKRLIDIGLALILFFPLASISWADVVELTTGQRVEGTLKQASRVGVVIEVGGQTITFEREKVRAIYFGAAPQSAKGAPAQEALHALKALDSAITVGVAPAEYRRRLADAKIIVDRYLGGPDGGAEVKRAVQSAIGYYILAETAWRRQTASVDTFLFPSEIPEDCHALTWAVENPGDRGGGVRYTPDKVIDGKVWLVRTKLVQILWLCASNKADETDRLLRGK